MTNDPNTTKDKARIYPVFLPMQGCPGRCVYCDQAKITGAGGFDLEQALGGIAEFIHRNPGQRKQVAFYGGSFTALDEGFRETILKEVGQVCDTTTSFRISTHPLYINDEILAWCKSHGIETIELGIQDFSDPVLAATGRGYGGKEAYAAAALVREAGFELGVQLMPGLPGWTEDTLAENFRCLSTLKPNLLRLYPCVVIRGTRLEEMYLRGEYIPLALDLAVSQCADYCSLAENNGIRVIKLGLPSNLPEHEIAGGPWHPAFGELVKAELLARIIMTADPYEHALRVGRDGLRLLKAHGGNAMDKVHNWFLQQC
jgi:histone acetyltransferase (RNA polymerase elongator complex component)